MTGRQRDVDVTHEFARAMRASMHEVNRDAWLLAEHCHDASSDLAGDGWQGTMNYPGLTRPLWSWLRSATSDVSILGVPGPVPRQRGGAVVAAMREVASTIPWQSLNGSMTLLDSHDTARAATALASRDHHLAAVGMMAAYVGVPMVFAGSEIGCEGVNADMARVPFNWDESTWDHQLLDGHRSALGARASSIALRHGGLRWLDVDDDHISFVREHRDETVMVDVWRSDSRSDATVSSPTVGDVLSEHLGDAGYRITRLR
jgi:alpha-glucosidase